MKKLLLIVAIASISLASGAQGKINPLGLIQLEKHRINKFNSKSPLSDSQTLPTVGVIVSLSDGASAQSLVDAGYEVTTDLGDMAVVRLPIDRVEEMAAMSQVRTVSFGGKKQFKLNFARAASGVDEAHAGIEVGGLSRQFTGDGVVVGLFDGGLQAGHINFSDAAGNSRVRKLWDYTGQEGSGKLIAASAVATFCDDQQESHATHVAGIMAGAYKGTGRVAMISNPSGSNQTINSTNIPFYGVATDADLAFCVGDAYDANIIDGVENIISYAESVGKPVAVNLSLGVNYGPHDGTDDFSQALDRLGERGIICVSAGNEGEDNISIEKEFTSSATSVKTILYFDSKYESGVYGLLDIWASDGQPLTVKIGNLSSAGTVTNLTTISSATATERTLTKGVNSHYGDVYYYAGLDPNSGRWNVMFDFEEARPSSGRFSIEVTGKEGQKVNIYLHAPYTRLTNSYSNNSTVLAGYTAGTPDQTINDMCCGSNTIAVGAYTTRNTWGALGGSGYIGGYVSDFPVGGITPFSSYGTTFGGIRLPHVAAPGAGIISSFNRYYIDGGYGSDYGETEKNMTASAANGSATDYWGDMEGTSMSCPYMTGTAALWLQADPTLTVGDIKDILSKTCKSDDNTAAAPERFGYGKLDAAAGLRYILSNAAIGAVIPDENGSVIRRTEGGIEVTMAGETSFQVSIVDLQGRIVSEVRSSGPSIIISTADLARGVYVVNARGKNLSTKLKIAI